jgi:glycosyltransferase involved in cell wall biosynthesis
LLPAVPEKGGPLVYDAHNMEAALKHLIYPPSQAGRLLLDSVTTIEREACARADEIWCCTDDDRRLLTAAYRLESNGKETGRFVSVPNGVDTGRIPYVSPTDRAQRRRDYGFGANTRPTAYFIGSWHGPNIDAAERIVQCAWYLQDIRFVIAGGVCDALRQRRMPLPGNVVLAGLLDDAASLALLTTCDMALNPMRGGSGSNLKIFEYCAAGAPVVTLQPRTHVQEAAFETFEEGLIAIWAETPERRSLRSRAARRHVEQHFDWDVIVAALLRDSPALATMQPHLAEAA